MNSLRCKPLQNTKFKSWVFHLAFTMKNSSQKLRWRCFQAFLIAFLVSINNNAYMLNIECKLPVLCCNYFSRYCIHRASFIIVSRQLSVVEWELGLGREVAFNSTFWCIYICSLFYVCIKLDANLLFLFWCVCISGSCWILLKGNGCLTAEQVLMYDSNEVCEPREGSCF